MVYLIPDEIEEQGVKVFSAFCKLQMMIWLKFLKNIGVTTTMVFEVLRTDGLYALETSSPSVDVIVRRWKHIWYLSLFRKQYEPS